MFEIADFIKARKESKDEITKVISAWSAREATIHDKGFQDGAFFGYNKAKEEMHQKIEKMKCCYNCSKDCGSIDRQVCFENKMKDWTMRC